MKEREIAFNCLCKVLIDKQFSNIVLKNNKQVTAFVTQLVYGTLRNYRLCRYAWLKYANSKPNNKVCILLDMACYELLLLNKPSYATVNEIVELAKNYHCDGFVNAILRKISKEDLNVDDFALKTSHPDWLYNLWVAHYGKEITEKMMLEDLKQAEVTVRVNTMLTSQEELLKDFNFRKTKTDNCLVYQGNVIESDYFKNNLVIIQSSSSMAAVNMLAPKDNARVLDLCCAPGSKTIQIAMMMHNTGLVVGNELYDFRCNLVRENVKKYQMNNVQIVNFDGREIDIFLPTESFDYCLLDAPCSGLGTLKHKPEIKITTTDKDLDNIVQLQGELLAAGAKMIKTGGIFVYSTCTLNKKENERQIENFIKNNQQFKLLEQKTIFPFDDGNDGFYIAKMVKC